MYHSICPIPLPLLPSSIHQQIFLLLDVYYIPNLFPSLFPLHYPNKRLLSSAWAL